MNDFLQAMGLIFIVVVVMSSAVGIVGGWLFILKILPDEDIEFLHKLREDTEIARSGTRAKK